MASEILRPTHGATRRGFIFSDEHEALRESMERWVKAELAPNAELWEETLWPDSVMHRMGELGFIGLCLPEEYGGQGGDYFYSIVRAEAMSHARNGGLATGVLVQTDMVLPPIEALGTEDLKQRYLPGAIAGALIGCLAITEPDAGSDVAGIRTTAVRDGDDYILNGTKMFITNGQRADFCLLVAKTDPDAGHQGITLFVVDTNSPGFQVSRTLEKLGMHSSDTAELSLTDVRVPGANILGTEGRGFYHISWELQGERLADAASCVAEADRLLESALAYAKERRAFGQPIGSFQAIRHKLATTAMRIDAARQQVYAAALLFANGEYPVREISMAKLNASRTCCEAADDCVQIFGGYGYMREYGIERAYRDVRLHRIGAGSDEIMLEVIGRSLGL